MLIFKEKLPIDTKMIKLVNLPYENAELARKSILHIGIQRNLPYFWYNAKEPSLPTKEYAIFALGTGQYRGIEDENMYIGTALLFGDSLVLHYFLTEKNHANIDMFIKHSEELGIMIT